MPYFEVDSPELEGYLGKLVYVLTKTQVQAYVICEHSLSKSFKDGKLETRHKYSCISPTLQDAVHDLAKVADGGFVFSDVGSVREKMIENATRAIDLRLGDVLKIRAQFNEIPSQTAAPIPNHAVQPTRPDLVKSTTIPTQDGEIVEFADGTKAKLRFKQEDNF